MTFSTMSSRLANPSDPIRFSVLARQRDEDGPVDGSLANTAALLANDNRKLANRPQSTAHGLPQKQQQPHLMDSGSSRAAFLAATSSTNPSARTSSQFVVHPVATSPLCAASPYVSDAPSLRGARLSMTGSKRLSMSATMTAALQPSYPDQENAARNALSAASQAHSRDSRPLFMSTWESPIHPHTDTQVYDHSEILQASAVAMVKHMYAQRQQSLDTAAAAQQMAQNSATSRMAAQNRHASMRLASSPSRESAPPPPLHMTSLNEAAYLSAQERLAKIHEEHAKNHGLADYYGTPSVVAGNHSTRLSAIKGKLNRRQTWLGGDESSPENLKRARQMSLSGHFISPVDEQQRTRDREALLGVARRNVQAQLKDIDQRIYAETGGAMPRQRSSTWHTHPQRAVPARSRTRSPLPDDKVDIGGGRFMDRSEIEAIAARRVQPLLDEIRAKVDAERERAAIQKATEARLKAEKEVTQSRDKEIKQIYQRIKGYQKEANRARDEEIRSINQQRQSIVHDDDDAHQPASSDIRDSVAHDSDHVKAINRRSVSWPNFSNLSYTQPSPQPAESEGPVSPHDTRQTLIHKIQTHFRDITASNIPRRRSHPSTASGTFNATSPDRDASHDISITTSPSTSPTAKVRNWFKTRLRRPRSKSVASSIGVAVPRWSPTTPVAPGTTGSDGHTIPTTKERYFIGGAALEQARQQAAMGGGPVDASNTPMRDTALVGRANTLEDGYHLPQHPEVPLKDFSHSRGSSPSQVSDQIGPNSVSSVRSHHNRSASPASNPGSVINTGAADKKPQCMESPQLLLPQVPRSQHDDAIAPPLEPLPAPALAPPRKLSDSASLRLRNRPRDSRFTEHLNEDE